MDIIGHLSIQVVISYHLLLLSEGLFVMCHVLMRAGHQSYQQEVLLVIHHPSDMVMLDCFHREAAIVDRGYPE
jgi:hypothetical protein